MATVGLKGLIVAIKFAATCNTLLLQCIGLHLQWP